MNKSKKLFFIFLLAMTLAPSLWAEEIPYDRYAAVWREGPLKKAPSRSMEALLNFGKHFLVYPFELIRWPVDKSLIYVEKTHLDDKVDWIYDQMKTYGVTPKLTSISGGDSFGGGVELEPFRFLGLKDRFPTLSLKGGALWSADSNTRYHVEILQSEIAGTSVRLGGNFKYENRGEEHFYGLGPDTSLGDGTNYEMEQTLLETVLGYGFLNTWDVEGKFGWQNVNIDEGEDDRRGQVDQYFVLGRHQSIPGLEGEEMLSWGLDLKHDNRDSPELPSEGGYQKVHFSFNKGMEHDTGFFKYRGEAAHFFKVFSKRRIFTLRGVVEHNDEVGDRSVPFWAGARLGGYGTAPRIGDTHRGFRRDRFFDESLLLFNMEYRWAAWEYRDFRMDPVVFSDVGQVFSEWSDFQFKDFGVSYGLGFRVSYEKSIVFTFEVARSNEGTQYYVKTKTPF